MMTFYSAVGCYRIRTEDGRKIPYIQKLGKLHQISVPEFFVWSTLLWDVLTYQELREHFNSIRQQVTIEMPELDQLLDLLVTRKLVIKGVGYTGADALYNMLSDAFVVPYRLSGGRKAWTALQLWVRGKLRVGDLGRMLKTCGQSTEAENRIFRLVKQTPLSTAELIRCFDQDIYDVSTPDKVIAGLYPEYESDQLHIANEEVHSKLKAIVLEAVSNLYLSRKVILETI